MNGFSDQQPSVLVIEDDATLARVVVHGLTARGYEAVGARTLAEAVAEIRERAPSVLLVDIDLPDGSGWDAIRAAREANGYNVKVIIMSALRPNSRLVAEFGCFGFLEKPFPMEALLRQVDTSLASDNSNDNDVDPWVKS